MDKTTTLPDAIAEVVGGANFLIALMLCFPPTWIFAGLLLLLEFCESFVRATPAECRSLLEADAHPADRALLAQLLRTTDGAPMKRQLTFLRKKLNAQIMARESVELLSRVNGL